MRRPPAVAAEKLCDAEVSRSGHSELFLLMVVAVVEVVEVICISLLTIEAVGTLQSCHPLVAVWVLVVFEL